MIEQKTSKKYQKRIVQTSFLIVFATLAFSIVGTSFTNTAFAEDKQKNIEIVEKFLAKAFDEKDPAGATAEYLSEDYMYHGLLDEEQVSEIIAKAHEILPDLVRTNEPTVADEDGDFIVVFSKFTSSGGDGEVADLFKVMDGKIIEHHQSAKFSDQLTETFKAIAPEAEATTDGNSTESG